MAKKEFEEYLNNLLKEKTQASKQDLTTQQKTIQTNTNQVNVSQTGNALTDFILGINNKLDEAGNFIKNSFTQQEGETKDTSFDFLGQLFKDPVEQSKFIQQQATDEVLGPELTGRNNNMLDILFNAGEGVKKSTISALNTTANNMTEPLNQREMDALKSQEKIISDRLNKATTEKDKKEATDALNEIRNKIAEAEQSNEKAENTWAGLDVSQIRKEADENIQKNTEEVASTGNEVAEKVAELAPSMAQSATGGLVSTVNPVLGTTFFVNSAESDYYDDAIERGMDKDEAKKYSTIMGWMEGATEVVSVGNLFKAGAWASKLAGGKGAAKELSTSMLKDYGIGIGENVVQEAIIEPISELTATITAGSDHANWDNMVDRMIQSGIDGGLSAALLGAATMGVGSCVDVQEKINNGQEVTQEEIQKAYQDAVNELGQNQVDEMVKQGSLDTINQMKTAINQQNQAETLQNEKTQLENLLQQAQTEGEKATLQHQIAEIESIMPMEQARIENETVSNETQQTNPYAYEKSDNTKVDNLRRQASELLDDSDKSKTFVSNLEKIIQDKDYEINLVKGLTDKNGNVANGSITKQDGKTIINLNTESNKAAEFIITHEVGHAISTPEMIKMITDYASKNTEFAEAVESLKQTYETEEINDEVASDIMGQYLGNQEFLNSLSMEKPGVFKRMYDAIISLANKITGNSNEALFIKDLQNKFQQAYRETQGSNIQEGETSYSIQTNNDGGKFVNIDINQNLFEGKSKKEQTKIAHDYILNNFRKNGLIKDLDNINVTRKTANEYTHPKRNISNEAYSAKMKASTELDNLLEISKFIKSEPDDGRHIFAKNGWNYYETVFKVGDKTYSGLLNIADGDKGKLLYDVTNIKERASNYSVKTVSVANSNINNIITSSNENVNLSNNNMQKSENNTQLENSNKSSFSMAQVYSKNNSDNAINNLNNIENFTVQKPDNKYDEVIGYSFDVKTDTGKARLAIRETNDTVYLNNIITRQGNNAGKGAGTKILNNLKEYCDKTNKKLVITGTVDSAKGFYDKFNWLKEEISPIYDDKGELFDDESLNRIYDPNVKLDNNIEVKDNKGRELTKEQQEFFKDSKVRDEKGNLITMYHGTDADFNQFSYDYAGTTGLAYGKGFYFTDKQNASKEYGKNVKETYLDIKKPMEIGKTKMTKDEFRTLIQAVNEETNGVLEADYGDLEDAVMEYDYGGDDIDLTNSIKNASGLSEEKFYKVLRDTIGFDGIKANNSGSEKSGNFWIAFQSEQIKNVDNLKPTENPDIRYSKQNEPWQDFLESNFKTQGTTTQFSEILQRELAPVKQLQQQVQTLSKQIEDIAPVKENIKKAKDNPMIIAKLTKEDANTTPELKQKRYEKGNKQSSFVGNVLNDAQFLEEDFRQAMVQDENVRYYQGISNEQTLENAYKNLQDKGTEGVIEWLGKKEKFTAEDVATGWILLKQYQDKGDIKSAVEVAKKMRDIGTSAGQTVQAFNIMSRLTPDGMFMYAQNELTDAFEKMSENKTSKWIEENRSKFELTPEDTALIKQNMEDIANTTDERTKKVKLAEIQKIMTDKIPANAGKGVKAWMRISMLFNPKTQVRNVLGNAIIAPVNTVGDTFAAGVDKIISKKTGVRTTGVTNISSYAKGFQRGFFESFDDFKRGINTRDMSGDRFEIGEGKSFNNEGIGKYLNKIDNTLSFMLDAGDRPFYEAAFTNSINNQLVLNNATEVTQDMIDIATNEALQRTWQDSNKYTEMVLGIRDKLNNMGFGKNEQGKNSYGLGDVLIPFAKTPANLTKAIVDYSPVGLTKALTADAIKLNNSIKNGQYSPQLQHRFVQNLGKGMAGSLLYVAGYALAKAGIITGDSDDDKDVANFMKNSLGVSSYSIKIGDMSFTYDWAQPVAAPLSIMANVVNSENKGISAIEGIVGNLDTAGSILMEQSFLQSINDVLNNQDGFISGLISEGLELPSRAIPTISKQVADMVDGTQRTTFEYGNPIKSAINTALNKIPFASTLLPSKIDTLGNEVKKYGGDNNLFNVFLNPANTNKGELSEAGEEIYNIYTKTGNTSVFPTTAPYYVLNDGEKIIMTSEQRNQYQKTTGEYVENTVNKLLKDKDYQKLSDDEKAEVLKEIVSDSTAKAKYDVLGIDSKVYQKKREVLNKIDEDTYYNYQFKTTDLKKADEKIKVVLDSDYTDKEKTVLYENYISTSSVKDNEVTTYELAKAAGININEWLNYQTQDFASDKEDDGTLDGKSVSSGDEGSKKYKVTSYLNSRDGLTTQQKLLLYGTQYKMTTSQIVSTVNYVKSLDLTKEEKMESLNKIKGVTVYKNGTYKIK